MSAELVCMVLGDVIHVSKAAVIVGRGSESDLRIDDKDVSRRHCEIVLRRDAVIIRDLGSTHGTWFEGRRIEGELRVTKRTTIALGESGVPLEIVRATLGGQSILEHVSSAAIASTHTVRMDTEDVERARAASAQSAAAPAAPGPTAAPRSLFLRGFVIGSAAGLAAGALLCWT